MLLTSQCSHVSAQQGKSSHAFVRSASISLQAPDELTCSECRLPQRQRGHAETCAP